MGGSDINQCRRHRLAFIAVGPSRPDPSSFFMPLFAGVLVMLKPRWTYKAAVGATLAVFVISAWAFFRTAW